MSSNRTNHQNFHFREGNQVVDGKSHWKDLIQVHIKDPQEAFSLAMNILRQIETQQNTGQKDIITFILPGTLEPAE